YLDPELQIPNSRIPDSRGATPNGSDFVTKEIGWERPETDQRKEMILYLRNNNLKITTMSTRRDFMSTSVKAAAVAGLAPVIPVFPGTDPPFFGGSTENPSGQRFQSRKKYKLEQKHGLGGVAIGNAFRPTTDKQAQEAMEGAWEAGVRYFDTSPWYGLGLSERRFGHFLHNQKREDYILSTKIGRILKASKALPE